VQFLIEHAEDGFGYEKFNVGDFDLSDKPRSGRSSLIDDDTVKIMLEEILSHPPYSSDLAPSDYHLFLSLQNFLRASFQERRRYQKSTGSILGLAGKKS
ncbi:jg9928, partial [Pararge aegeria aegeria]